MMKLYKGLRGTYVLLVALVIFCQSAGATEIPPVSEAAFEKMKAEILGQKGREGGNWGYGQMEDWQKNQPPEQRVGQGRWEVPVGAWYFNLGPTGIRFAMDVKTPREIVVMYVFEDSPADKKIFRGDRIIGVNGKNFTSDEPFPSGSGKDGFRISGPRLEVAKAIEESEGNPSLNGILTLTVKRGLATIKVPIQLEKLGYFSPTFPYNCKKSRKLAEGAGDWLIENARKSTWRGKEYTNMAWGPPRMGDWIDLPAQLGLLSFGDRYKKYFEPEGSGGVMWSWIGGIRLITAAEKQQIFKDKGLITKLEEMSKEYAAKSGPSGAYSHKTWYEGAPFQLAFAAGLNALGQALAQKCGADIAEDSYLRTRYLLTMKTNEKGNIGYGAANATPYSAEDARKALGNINTKIIGTDEVISWRSVGGSACTTLTHFVDPRDSFSEAFVKRGVRLAMAAGQSSRQAHACGSLTFVYNALAASIAPLVGEEEMYRNYMDDMKWWLIMARCHNGGWVFDPKIDTEANDYDRIHMTAAALLMLNAPLRQLYSNGKGRTDPGAAKMATTRPEPSTPIAPSSPVRKARSLKPERLEMLNNSLKSSLEKVSSSGGLKPIPIVISLTRARVWLKEMGSEGNMTFQVVGGTQTADFKWDALSAADYATLSLLLANLKTDSEDAQAMAGVYLESIGKANDAEKYYAKAGSSSAAKLQKLFE